MTSLSPRVSRRQVLGLIGISLGMAACGQTAGTVREPSPTPIYGPEATVSPDDDSIDSGEVDFAQGRDRIILYRSRPKGRGPYPAVLLLHDTRGMSDFIRDTARKMAKLGYVGLAIDFLWRNGGTDNAGDFSSISSVLNRMPPERAAADVVSSLNYMKSLDFVDGKKMGLVGYDFGASAGLRAAADTSDAKALVAYSPENPTAGTLAKVKSPVLGIYAELDSRLNKGIPDLADGLKRAGVPFESFIEPGVERGFQSASNIEFDAKAAGDAWGRTLAFLDKYLKG